MAKRRKRLGGGKKSGSRKRRSYLPTKSGKKGKRKGSRVGGFAKKKGYKTSSLGNPVIYTKSKFRLSLWGGSLFFGGLIGWLTKANLPGKGLAPKSGAGKELGLALLGIGVSFAIPKKYHKVHKWAAIGTSSALSVAAYKVMQFRNDAPGVITSINGFMSKEASTPTPDATTSTPTANPPPTPTATPATTGYSTQGRSVQGYSTQGHHFATQGRPIGEANPAEVNVNRELRWGE